MADPRARLFFALLPPPGAADELDRLAPRSGDRVARERRHVTLALLGDFALLPRSLVARAGDAVSAHTPDACRVVVDLLVSGRRSTLLMPSEPVHGLLRLQAWLAVALARAGIVPPQWWRFAPHVTLGYRGASGPTRAIDPIGWRAEELLLIHSHLGRGRHDVVGRWSLRVAPE